jgi:hypothetical protein
LFAIKEKTIIRNTRDLVKKILKMNIAEEEIRENTFDKAPKILFTRKIKDSMFDCSQKISSKIRSFSALAGMGYNYYISE